MTCDLSTIPYADISPRDVIFARLEGDKLDNLIYVLRDKVGDVRVIPINPDTEVLVVDERTMNQMGWFRKP